MNIEEAGKILQRIDISINTKENRRSLVDAGEHAQKIIAALRILKRAGILYQANVDSLVNAGEYLNALADGLSILYNAFLLNEDNFIALSDTQGRVGAVVDCLNMLHFEGFLNKPNFYAVIAALEDGDALVSGFLILNGAGILNQLNITAIVVAREDARCAVANDISRVFNAARIRAQPNHDSVLLDAGWYASPEVVEIISLGIGNSEIAVPSIGKTLEATGLFATKTDRTNTSAADDRVHNKLAKSSLNLQ